MIIKGAVKGATMAHVQAPLRCFGDRRATKTSSSLIEGEPIDFGCISGICTKKGVVNEQIDE